MHSLCFHQARALFSLTCLGLAVASASPVPAQTLEAASVPAQATAPVQETLNTLAHRVLSTGLRVNGLTESGHKPWHLRLEYQLLQPGYPKPIRGTMEEWYAGPHRWKRTWEGVDPSMSSTVWSVGLYERFLNRRHPESVEQIRLDLHVAGPAIDPLERAALIGPDDPMDIKIVKSEGNTLNCISVLTPYHDSSESKPDPRFPTLCFDKLNHLRLASTENLAVEFEDFELFDQRAVAHHVRLMANHRLVADIRVNLLEPLSDSARVEPPPAAVPEPFLLQPGFPVPHAIFEAGAHVPLQPDGYPYRGRVLAMLVIKENGAVKLNRALSFAPSPDVLDSIELAVRRWKYQPYMLDGQAVDVEMVVPYLLDSKPFMPSYKRELPPALMDPEDYLNAESYRDMQGGGPPRRRRGR